MDRRRFRRVSFGLDGSIQLQRIKETLKCVIRDISEGCMGVGIVTSDSSVCDWEHEDVNVSIYIPGEGSPVVCSGRIAWSSLWGDRTSGGVKGYRAGLFIIDISQSDEKRLSSAIARRKAFLSRIRGT
jgi:c-di-GMP-binding flagellar brake protein YcgR